MAIASLFLSHSHLDKDAAYQIYWGLREEGIYCWVDKAEIKPGDSLIAKIQDAIKAMDYLGVVLSPASVSSSWVQTEVNAALITEIDGRQVKVIPLQVADCEMPLFLAGKHRIDFRSDFKGALAELANFLRSAPDEIPLPKQAVLAKTLEKAGEGLWQTFSMGMAGADLDKQETANLLRNLSERELEAAVAISHDWWANEYKRWESYFVDQIRRRVHVDENGARRILRKLEEDGFIEKATDLDYSRREQAYTQGDLAWIVKRVAQQTGVFDYLPRPEPYTLSQFLTSKEAVLIFASDKGWSAGKSSTPMPAEDGTPVLAVVSRESPPRSWSFSSDQDECLRALDKTWPLGKPPLGPGSRSVFVRLTIDEFDDLHLLR
jgi:TIR domain